MKVGINGWYVDIPYSGSGQYLRHLLYNLPKVAPDADLVLVVPSAMASKAREACPNTPLQIVSVPIRPSILGKILFEQIGFVSACREVQVDLIHVPYWGGPFVSPYPVVVTVFDIIPLLLPEYRGGVVNKWYIRLVTAAAKRSRAIITISESSRRDIIRSWHIKPEQIYSIYLGHDYHDLAVSSVEHQSAVRAKYGLPSQYVLYFGGFHARKNLEVVLRAYTYPDPVFESFPLVVAGRLPEIDSRRYPDPHRIVRQLGLEQRVRFIGPFAERDKRPLLEMASAFVYLSRYEGFGLPPLEAMACGTPVVTSTAGAVAEVVGSAGMLCEPDDINCVRDSLTTILTNSEIATMLGQAGQARAASFSWRRCAEQTVFVYKQLLAH